MTGYTLYGRNASPYTRRTAIVMRLLDLPFKQVVVSPFTDLDEIRKVNPLGRVPVLRLADGTCLVESACIIDHLLGDHDGDHRILPAGGPDRRRDLQLVALCQTATDKGVLAGHELLMRPAEKRHAPFLQARIDQARAAMLALEDRLADRPLPGGTPSLGEITAAVTLDFLDGFMPFVLRGLPLPATRSLGERLEATDSFTAQAPEARMGLDPAPDLS
ncbi:MAG: glutathione S-transferase [Rhodobacteraceae bacterium]|nr:glutathione S-transferase [Paracoccaceae bacterium]